MPQQEPQPTRWTPATAIAHTRARLAVQGCGCVDTDGRCHYILADGRRCAIGWLLTAEDAWDAERRGLHATDAELVRLVFGCEPPWGAELLRQLREAHDPCADEPTFMRDFDACLRDSDPLEVWEGFRDLGG